MPVFRLPDELIFPDPGLAEKDGLLAVGGDLSESRLLLAYSMGIFPWYSDGSPILWWSPDPRLVLMPGDLKVSRSLKQVIKGTLPLMNAPLRGDQDCAEITEGQGAPGSPGDERCLYPSAPRGLCAFGRKLA
jgi:hypothetical protein